MTAYPPSEHSKSYTSIKSCTSCWLQIKYKFLLQKIRSRITVVTSHCDITSHLFIYWLCIAVFVNKSIRVIDAYFAGIIYFTGFWLLMLTLPTSYIHIYTSYILGEWTFLFRLSAKKDLFDESSDVPYDFLHLGSIKLFAMFLYSKY